MSEAISVGSVSVDVVPDASRFATTLRGKIDPQVKSIGEQIGKQLSDQLAKGIRDGIGNGFRDSAPRARREGQKSGTEFGGSFAREAKSRIEAALKSLPDAKIGVATTEAEQKLKDLRAEMLALSDQTIGVDITDAEALAKIDDLKFRLDRLAAESPSVQVKVDAAAAITQLAAVQSMVNRVDGTTAEVKVRADTSQARREIAGLSALSGGGMGGMMSAALGLGPALIPVGAVAGGLGAALAAPAAAAGGGLAIGALVAKAAVKRTQEQLKQIAQLRKQMVAARAAVSNAHATSGASAANSLATAQRSRDNAIASARASLSAATTPAARAAAERRIASAEAAFSARQAAISATATAHQTAAQRKLTEATAAYKAALAGLSPAQTRYMKAQEGLKQSFGNLIKTAGPVVLGPVTKGMDLLAKILPKLSPVLTPVSKAIGGLLADIGKFAGGKRFSDLLADFGKFAGSSISSFGRDLGDIALGFAGLFKALEPMSGTVLSGLSGMFKSFADFGAHASQNKGLQRFLAYVRDEAPKVGRVVGDLAVDVGKLVAGLAPLGDVILGAIGGIASFLRTAKPSTISALGIAVGGLALAFGKGPLGLAFALGATLSHSKGFVNFLKDAGKYVGEIARAYDKLPAWAKTAAAVGLGAGVIAKKTGLLGGGGGLIKSILGGGVAKGPLRAVSKAGIVPVYVTNKGFSDGPGGKKGLLATLAMWGLRTSPYTLPLLTGGDHAPGQDTAGLTKPQIKAHHSMQAALAGLYKGVGADKFGFKNGRSGDAVLAGLLTNDPSRGLSILKKAADTAGVSMDKFATAAMPKTQAAVRETERKFGNLETAIRKTRSNVRQLESELTGLPKNLILRFRAQDLANDIALVRKYGSWLDHLDGRVVRTFIKTNVNHHANQLNRFHGGIPVGATGGIVNRPTLALIGEAGPEAVVPLNRTPGNSPLPDGLRGGLHVGQQHFHGVDYHQWRRDQEHDMRVAALGGANFRG